MLFFLGEWFHWLSLSWRRRKKLGRPATAAELLNAPYKLSKSNHIPERYVRGSVAADEFEAGMFPWERRRADDE